MAEASGSRPIVIHAAISIVSGWPTGGSSGSRAIWQDARLCRRWHRMDAAWHLQGKRSFAGSSGRTRSICWISPAAKRNSCQPRVGPAGPRGLPRVVTCSGWGWTKNHRLGPFGTWRRTPVQPFVAHPKLWTYYPDWSSNGQFVAFSASPAHYTGEDWDLAITAVVRPHQFMRLTHGAGNDRLPDWKP